MSGRFVLVVSYPKSGNTWTRLVLEHLRRGAGLPFPINDLDANFHGAARRYAFDSWMPVNAAELLTVEMEGYLPDLYRRLAPGLKGVVFVKAHDAAKRNFRGEWIYPPDCMSTVLYLVRHPFDVAVSTSHHLGVSPERAVEIMADDGSQRGAYRSMPQSLPQTFGSWSGNVDSWIGNHAYGVTWARYEDLCADPIPNFARLAQAAGLPVGRDDVAAVVEATRFRRLQQEEDVMGFRERPPSSPRFFREGRSGTWKGNLDDVLRERLLRDHGGTMQRLGYNEDGSTAALQAG
jgi:aryl sulfotransferase